MVSNKNQSIEDNNLKTLWVLLSALGLLIIVGTAGFFFFSPDRAGDEIKPVLASTTLVTQEKVEEFDPIEWSRESDEYPGLEENPEDLIEVELLSEEIEPVVEKTIVVTEPAPVPKVKTPVYKEVSQLVFWIQVGSYSSMTKAESVSDFLKEKGLSSTVQTKDIDGSARYRVRIGAFNTKEEAEKFSLQVKALKGYEESYVIQSVQVKKVIVNS